MSNYSETIKANKYHSDTGYKVKNHSKDAWLLTNKIGESKFTPKSVTKTKNLDNGNVEITIESWWYGKNRGFFIT